MYEEETKQVEDYKLKLKSMEPSIKEELIDTKDQVQEKEDLNAKISEQMKEQANKYIFKSNFELELFIFINGLGIGSVLFSCD